MKLNAFAALDAVLRRGSLAAAAQEMNLTTSALSVQMKQLERHMGQPLFDRSRLQLKPLALAFHIADVMRDSLAQIEQLRMRSTAAVAGTVRLGVIETMQPQLLPGLMRLLRDRYPQLQVRPARGRSAALTDEVKAGRLDAAVVAQPPAGATTRLHWLPLLRRELALVAPPASTETSPAALFKQHDWIQYDRQTIAGTLAARWVKERYGLSGSALLFDSVPAIAAMVSAGLGVSVIQPPSAGVMQEFPVRVLSLGRGAPTLTLSLVMRREDAESGLLTVLAEAMVQVLGPSALRRR